MIYYFNNVLVFNIKSVRKNEGGGLGFEGKNRSHQTAATLTTSPLVGRQECPKCPKFKYCYRGKFIHTVYENYAYSDLKNRSHPGHS